MNPLAAFAAVAYLDALARESEDMIFGEVMIPVGCFDDGAPGQPSAAHSCQHCVCPAVADTPEPIVQILPVAYAVAEAPVADTPRGVRPLPRAPPRPPGQGPPLPNT